MHLLKTFVDLILLPIKLNSWISDLLIAIPRFLCGMVLAIDFGASKFGMPWTDPEKNLGLFEVAAWFPEDVAKFGFPFTLSPWLFAWLGAASEAIGGLFLAAGLLTRFAAFLIGSTMLVAIFFQKWGQFLEQGFWPILPALGFLWVAVYSFVIGSGRIGADYWIHRRIAQSKTES